MPTLGIGSPYEHCGRSRLGADPLRTILVGHARTDDQAVDALRERLERAARCAWVSSRYQRAAACSRRGAMRVAPFTTFVKCGLLMSRMVSPMVLVRPVIIERASGFER